jgi:hypothetical protein
LENSCAWLTGAALAHARFLALRGTLHQMFGTLAETIKQAT